MREDTIKFATEFLSTYMNHSRRKLGFTKAFYYTDYDSPRSN